jgi:crotonobetainyl-CoA:carnitine CoA-transferase CaiB-like acyl-CoA transferase
MGRADLLEGDRLATPTQRMQHSDEVDAIVADWCRSLPLVDIEDILTRHEVPHSKVYSIEDVLADAHVQARQAIIQLPDPDLGQVAAPCVVPRFSNHQPVTPRSGPDLGEHNAQVYGELGLSQEELAQLKKLGVI